MASKKLTIEDLYEFDRLLSQAEEILRNTRLDDECYLVNHIRSYVRIKRNQIDRDEQE
jgi:hypothetical protein